ncbi:MAG TPA: two-component regulator propeller domain-containing protein [Candidatus Polarisedimenticolaceae bacterium]
MCGPASAERLPFRAYGSGEGLAGDHVRAILQDRQGFLWLATNAGVSRFDGHTFRNFGIDDGLPVPSAWALAEDADGSLYALVSQRVVRRPPRRSTGGAEFEPVASPALERHVGDVFAMGVAPDGALLLAGSRGAARLVSKDGATRVEPVDLGPAPLPERKSAEHVWAAAYDGEGALWAARTYGITRVGSDGTTRTLPLSYEEQVNSGWGWLPSMTLDRAGRPWLLTVGSGAWCLGVGPGGDPTILERLDPSTGCPSPFPRGFWEDADGTIWIGTSDRGLVRIEGSPGHRRHVTIGRAQGLPDNQAYGVVRDLQGNLWAGTLVAGAARLGAEGLTRWEESDGVPAPTQVQALWLEPGEDLVVVLGGLRFASLGSEAHPRISTWAIRPEIVRGWGSHQILARGRDRRLWVATYGGLAVYAPGTNVRDLATARPVRVLRTTDGLPLDLVHRVFAASDGSVWFGVMDARRGVCRVAGDGDRVRCFGAEDGLPEYATGNAFAEDAAGNVWFGLYDGGVFRYRDGRIEGWEEVDPERQRRAAAIYRDGKGDLWIAGRPALVRVERAASNRPSFRAYGATEGLFTFEASTVVDDLLGRVYVGGSHGVERLDPATGAVRRLTTADGLPSNRIACLLRDPSGALWIGTSHGVARLLPAPAGDTTPPRVYLTGLRVAGVERDPAGSTTLASDERTLEFTFTAPSFRAGETMRFQWRLLGASDDWSAPATSRSVVVASVAPGRYRFEVRAVDGEGLTGEPVAAAFSIRPPLWRRGWFLTAVGLTLATAAVTAYRMRVARLLELERVRTRIATDLHDDVGASLSQIAVLSQLASRQAARGEAAAWTSLARITELSGGVVDAMSDVVWSINPARDRVSDLVHRMRRFAVDLFAEGDVRLVLDLPEDDADARLDPEARREIYLVFKEALRNAARHAEARTVEVRLARRGDGLALVVRDDGVGIVSGERSGGSGLESMQRRAAALGGTLFVRPYPAGGTEVLLEVPARPRRLLSRWTATRPGGRS